MKVKHIATLSLLSGICLPATAQYDIIDSVAFKAQRIDIGANRTFSREQSSAAVSLITNKDVDNRGSRNIGNEIVGQGNGLVSMQGSGTYSAANPTFYVRGLQSLTTTNSSPLILVDGIERSINDITAEEVESVSILKDAAATALYGYRGINGAILVTTKHGKYNTKEIKFSYDHTFQFMTNKPKMVNAATYANAVNEAYRNEGGAAVYSQNVINAYQNQNLPLLYPNVNWADETFRNTGHNNRYNIEFNGGTRNFRYFTMASLTTDRGFIKQWDTNDSYSTQNKYSRGTLRSNMDIDLTPTTELHTHILGILDESSVPGSNVDIWSMIYKTPANAFPTKLNNSVWGGNSTYTTSNPVAQSAGAGYYKTASRGLYADMNIKQDLKSVTPGLSAEASVGYDTYTTLYENHSKTYVYGAYSYAGDPTGNVDLADASLFTDGADTELGTSAATSSWARHFIFNLAVNYDRTFAEKHAVYSQLKWDYQYSDETGVNTTVYRQNLSWLGHYGYDNRYMADLILTYQGSSRLAPDTKWAFSPTLAASWNIHREAFMQDVDFVDFLKLRASAGLLQTDYLPGSSVWTYYKQAYVLDGTTYLWYGTDSPFGRTYLGQAPSVDPSREKALKFNVGADATLFKGLNVSLDYYYQNRYDIFVATDGTTGAIFGFTSPYENQGKVTSYGFEASVDYSKQHGDWTYAVGATFNYMHNEIKEQAEEPKAYSNLVTTGNSLGQCYGYVANGFFQKSDDLNGDGIISTAEMSQLGYPTQTFATIYPGDVKYNDVNGDGKVDANDVTAIGHSTYSPDIYYTFHLGLSWKSLGFDAQFQGTGRYSGVMNTNGLYRSAVATNTLSQYLYDNAWSAERGNTENPKFPRLSPTSNANNDVTSTLNLFDRSYFKLRSLEVFYYLPEAWMQKTGFISKTKFYLRGTDLFCIDNLDKADAEVYGAVQPLSRNLQVGVALSF